MEDSEIWLDFFLDDELTIDSSITPRELFYLLELDGMSSS